METLVLNREQALHLQKDLGLDMSDAKLCFFEYPLTFNSKGEIRESQICIHGMEEMKNLGVEDEVIPTYTLQEIWLKLPEVIDCNGETYYLTARKDSIYYVDVRGNHCITFDRISILFSAYEMLCWVIENGHLKTK